MTLRAVLQIIGGKTALIKVCIATQAAGINQRGSNCPLNLNPLPLIMVFSVESLKGCQFALFDGEEKSKKGSTKMYDTRKYIRKPHKGVGGLCTRRLDLS